jgi:hypothetical protein
MNPDLRFYEEFHKRLLSKCVNLQSLTFNGGMVLKKFSLPQMFDPITHLPLRGLTTLRL